MPTPQHPPVEHPIYPAIDPFRTGLLDTASRHRIYFEECGNPNGIPALVLHGGPGSGCTPGQRRFFDPESYRIILFDQRGCGRSEPAGCIEDNTTSDLISDIELLRKHLGIGRWLIFGGSWGSTLALAYATQHASNILALVLRGIFLARPQELNWFLYGSRHFFPEAWEAFTRPVRKDSSPEILEAYRQLIFGSDPDLALEAAKAWGAYESAILSLLPPVSTNTTLPSDSVILSRARVQLHYLIHGCFLEAMPWFDRLRQARAIPAVIVQGRYDMVCPPSTAFELHQAWPEAEYRMIPDAGHAAFEPGISAALVKATEHFKRSLSRNT